MGRHATTANPERTQVERLTETALTTGRAALEKFGPEAAVAAMSPWAEALVKAERKAMARAERT
jgi:hypothetical protein